MLYWIIDSGAIDHITCSFDNFLNFSKIKPIHINLPNGSTIVAHISETVQLSPQLIIQDVLMCQITNLIYFQFLNSWLRLITHFIFLTFNVK